MSSKDSRTNAHALLVSYLNEHPDASPADLHDFVARHPRQAKELAELLAAIEDLRTLVDLPLHAIAVHLQASPHSTDHATNPRGRVIVDTTPASRGKLEASLPPQTDTARRYRVEGEVARGGMGTILKVWDNDLRRHLAMKVSLTRTASSGNDVAQQLGPRRTARFLEEAQITGQLDHPGIVPVHELGLDASGNLYFTMRLIRGHELGAVFELVEKGTEGWTRTRALGVLLRVCEAVAYAHSKGVVHRDLKPSNVMVGRFGEVYVMDWGLAKVLGESPAIPPALDDDAHKTLLLDTLRNEAGEEGSDSPLITQAGQVIGTPSYMPPEQAAGNIAHVGPALDVYAAGAILYRLLSGRRPYEEPGTPQSASQVLHKLLVGPPASLRDLEPSLAAELEAICSKAMARNVADRYSSMEGMAEDLRAYLEGRVVSAFEAGPWAEARKWMQRNKALASALAAAVFALAGGLVLSLIARSRAIELSTKVLQLSHAERLHELLQETERLWPVRQSKVDAMRAWLDEARELHGMLDLFREDLQTLRRQRGRVVGAASEVDPGIVLAAEASSPSAVSPEDAPVGQTWTFADEPTQWYHDTLARLVDDLERLADPDPRVGAIAQIDARIERAVRAHEESLVDPAAQELWAEAIASIRDRRVCPQYAGLELRPQEGLLPIGRNQRSGLWEFAHLASGVPPLPETDGTLFLTEETAIVFVLLPAGRPWIGTQSSDPGQPNYDPLPPALYTRCERIDLVAFFISKYEVTQNQWQRMSGSNPAYFSPGFSFQTRRIAPPFTTRYPVEQVSWFECARWLGNHGLAIPRDSQWEYAARAGTVTIFSTGNDPETLEGFANIADLSGRRAGDMPRYETFLDDGWIFTAPVGSFGPNAFGIHDMHGNVSEWCASIVEARIMPSDLLDAPDPPISSQKRAHRGGCFKLPASFAKCAAPDYLNAGSADRTIGIRPVRAIEP